jgi:hypothetical protein
MNELMNWGKAFAPVSKKKITGSFGPGSLNSNPAMLAIIWTIMREIASVKQL